MSKQAIGSHNQRQRFVSVALCAVLLAVMAFSCAIILLEHDHDCSGDDCPTCLLIHQAEENVMCLGQANMPHAHAIVSSLAMAQLSFQRFVQTAPTATLISLKVRQNK